MNKIILTLLVTILFTPAANAQNCVNSARCDDLGYTKSTTDCTGLDTLVCPFDENKVFCVSNKNGDSTSCQVGDILYSDKTCSSEIITAKIPIAIIFDTEKRLATALEASPKLAIQEATISYDIKDITSLPNITGNSEDFNGKGNTAKIEKFCTSSNLKCPAAKWSLEYSTAGTNQGDWYIPAISELYSLCKNIESINKTLKRLTKKHIGVEYLWSSSKTSENKIWTTTVSFSSSCDRDNSFMNGWPGLHYQVRPILTY